MKTPITVIRFATGQALVACFWFTALAARGTDSPPTNSTMFRAVSSNGASVGRKAATTNWSNGRHKPLTLPGLVESNGLYSIDIRVRPQEELLPAGICPRPMDMHQALVVYAELSGVELQVAEDVRKFSGLIQFPTEYPPMTRVQTCERFERTLREQAGVEVLHPDSKHAIVRLQKKPPRAAVE